MLILLASLVISGLPASRNESESHRLIIETSIEEPTRGWIDHAIENAPSGELKVEIPLFLDISKDHGLRVAGPEIAEL
jgi:hypothetical protein